MRRFVLPLQSLVLLSLFALAGGCTKRIPVDADAVDVADGRRMEITFADGSMLEGRIVRGSMVRFTRSDSLFEADINDVDEGFIELARQKLLTDENDWTHLMRLSENSNRVSEREDLGGTILMVDDIRSVTLLETDTRRTVTEAMFWTAVGLTAGAAAFSP